MAAIAATVAGCGGSNSNDGEGTTYSVEANTVVTTSSIAKAHYVPRINRLCRKAWGIILSNFTEYSSVQDPKVPKRKRFEEAVQLSLLAGIVFHIFDGIYNFGVPEGEEREVEEIIGSLESAAERGQKKLAPVSSIPLIVELFGEYNERAEGYGLDECLVDEARLQQLNPQ